MTYKEAVVALVSHVKAGYSGLPILEDPTEQADISDYPNGWVELHTDFGEEGFRSRFGDKSFYTTIGALTCTILTPRDRGDGPAWSAADALATLLQEAFVGSDFFVTSIRVDPAPLEDGDTHVEIQVIATFDLDLFRP